MRCRRDPSNDTCSVCAARYASIGSVPVKASSSGRQTKRRRCSSMAPSAIDADTGWYGSTLGCTPKPAASNASSCGTQAFGARRPRRRTRSAPAAGRAACRASATVDEYAMSPLPERLRIVAAYREHDVAVDRRERFHRVVVVAQRDAARAAPGSPSVRAARRPLRRCRTRSPARVRAVAARCASRPGPARARTDPTDCRGSARTAR